MACAASVSVEALGRMVQFRLANRVVFEIRVSVTSYPILWLSKSYEFFAQHSQFAPLTFPDKSAAIKSVIG